MLLVSELTVVVVSRHVRLVNQQVVVLVELPELAVDHVEVFVGEVLGDLEQAGRSDYKTSQLVVTDNGY